MKGIRLVVAVLVALGVLGSSIALAQQGEAGSGVTEASSEVNGASGEITASRTATSRTFELPDGKLETRIYQTPVNYPSTQTSWKPIGERLRAVEGETPANGANGFEISLPEQIDADAARVSLGEQWVASELTSTGAGPVQLEGGTATYESPTTGVSFNYSGLADGLKEDIELASPSDPSTFGFELSASSGLAPRLEEGGAVAFRDEQGKLVALLPPPVMLDSAGAESRAVRYELGEETDGHWMLTLRADRDWLSDPQRSFPATIDPTITTGPPFGCVIGGKKGETGWIDCASWGRTTFLAGYTPKLSEKEDSWWRTLMNFKTDALPPTAEVSSAKFFIRSTETAQNTKGVELRKITKPWTWQASWSRYDGPEHLWTSEGGDYSESLGEVLTSKRGNQAGWWEFSLPAKAVEEEAAEGTELPVMMKLIDDKARECGKTSCTNRQITFDSSAAKTEANRPYLSVVYTMPSSEAPIAEYSFNEGTGEVAKDGSTHGHDGALKNGAKWSAEGRYGGALSFDGKDDLITVPSSKELELSRSFTLEAWAKPEEANEWSSILVRETPEWISYVLEAEAEDEAPAGFLIDNEGEEAAVEGTSALPAKTWSYLALTSDGEYLRLYLNGKLVGTAAAVQGAGGKGPLQIGGNASGDNAFKGLIDNIRLYNRTLSGAEVEKDEERAVGAKVPGATTEVATALAGSMATLTGSVNPNGATTTYQFEYGTTTAYGTKVPASPESAGAGIKAASVSKAISSLKEGTTYHFRLVASNEVGTVYGEDFSFATPAKPTVTTNAATQVKTSKAMLNATVDPNGLSTTYVFDYGTSEAYGYTLPLPAKAIGSGTNTVEVSEAIDSLEPNTTYHFRIRAENSEGSAGGSDHTFSTPEWPIDHEPGLPSTSNYNDISCISASNCVAVGSWDASGVNQTQIRHWGGSGWAIQDSSAANATSLSTLNGVTCASSSWCVAVGSYVYEGANDKTLALEWDGEEWTIMSTPDPSGAVSSELAKVSCSGPEACMAVGKYTDAEDNQKTLAMQLNGASWSIAATPNVSKGSLDELSGIACRPDYCLAVGSFLNTVEVTKTLAMTWDGKTWSIESTPEPIGATLTDLSNVACLSATECTAVGTYFDASGVQKTFVLSRSSKGWSIAASPNPPGALGSKLEGISCSSSSACTAVGSYMESSGEVPLALRWNGEAWSEQKVDAASFGAVSVEYSAVACTGVSTCQSVGSITYGHGGIRKNLAYVWEGSVWVLTEAAVLTRRWHREAVLPASGRLTDTQCFKSVESCISTGTFKNGRGVTRGYTGGLAEEVTPMPAEAKASELEALNCTTSAANCLAVGSYRDSTGADWAMALERQGGTWSLLSVPVPSKATGSRLMGVSCSSSTYCLAVGSYRESTGITAALALIWNGSSWLNVSPTPPVGAQSSEFLDASCGGSTSCAVVGRFVDAEGEPRFLAFTWDGSEWTTVELTSALGGIASHLTAVDCPGATSCIAIGSYLDSQGTPKPFAIQASKGSPQSEWDIMEGLAALEKSAPQLTDLTCQSTSSCIAVGSAAEGEEGRMPLVLAWNQGTWSDLGLGKPTGVEATSYSLAGVTCVSATNCNAVGSITSTDEANEEDFEYTLHEVEGMWHVGGDAGGPSSGSLRGVSCVRTTEPSVPSCVVVGSQAEPGRSEGTSWMISSAGVAEVPFGVETPAVADVGCSSTTACTAVGAQGAGLIIRRWNGSSWASESAPSVSGATSVVASGVSCPTGAYCKLAGYSKDGSGHPAALIATWNGSSWAIDSAPTELASKPIVLTDVSCASTDACIAVGATSDNVSGVVERWNGSSWKAEATPGISGSGTIALTGVSCSSPVTCTAVGRYAKAESPKLLQGLIERWNGTSWTSESPPSAKEGALPLADVSCFSSSGCVAFAEGSAGTMIAWDGSKWSLEDTSFGSTGVTVEEGAGVACSAAVDCVATATTNSANGDSLPFLLEPTEDRPEVTIGGTPGAAASLSVVQEEQVETILAQDTTLQAKIGSEEYATEIIPWTETIEGEQVVIGANAVLTTSKPQTWSKYETWPTVTWNAPIEPDPYTTTQMKASASEVSTLQVNVAAVTDLSENFVEGEVVQLAPLTDAGGEVKEEPPITITENPEFLGY